MTNRELYDRGLRRPLRILSIEDDPGTVKGTLSSLSRDGHIVRKAENASAGEEKLLERDFDLLLVDERLPDKVGSEVIAELKQGDLGMRNEFAWFMMVTANPEWPPEETPSLPGFLGFGRKGGNLTPQIKSVVDRVRQKPQQPGVGNMRRVISRVVSLTEDGEVRLRVPSWSQETEVPVARSQLTGAGYMGDSELVGSHFFLWINFGAKSVNELDVANVTPAERFLDV